MRVPRNKLNLGLPVTSPGVQGDEADHPVVRVEEARTVMTSGIADHDDQHHGHIDDQHQTEDEALGVHSFFFIRTKFIRTPSLTIMLKLRTFL